MIRVVLDTNVYVSSLLSPAGTPARIVSAWHANAFEICLSEPLLQEIAQVLGRPAIRRVARITTDQIEEFIELLAQTAYFVDSSLLIEPVIADDPDDDVILATAAHAQAEVIVSGDHHLQALKEYRGIPIINPRTFLELLSEYNF